jgi:hypothetical protein
MGLAFAKAIRAGEVQVKETSLDDSAHSGSGRGSASDDDDDRRIPF